MEKDEKSGRMRIALSMKQAQPDPWDFVESKLKTGDTVSGKVTRCSREIGRASCRERV